MDKMKKLVADLDQEIIDCYKEYQDLMIKFDSHRGKRIDENLDEVNALLDQIQDKFKDLYLAFYFIAERHQLAVNTSNVHIAFIEDIKKAGAKGESDEQEIKH